VFEELDAASRVHRRLRCPVIDVSELSVEETAMRIVRLVADRGRQRVGARA
jgi:regulator of PEP synthase PpsR (kinase-PPPase family)